MIEEALRHAFITTERPYVEGAVEVFEQPLSLEGSPAIAHATLAITALGMYEAELDGAKVGEDLLTPGFTYYPYDLPYQTYDVTAAMAAGAERLRVYLAQGWYCGRFTCDNKTQIWGERPAVAWVLTVELADGTARVFSSADANVEAVESPYDYAGLYDGEVLWAHNARAKRESAPDVFAPVPYTGALPEEIRPATIHTIAHERIEPVRVDERADGTVIVDFGQNMAGIVELDRSLIAPDATCVTIRHGELLNPDGSLYTANLRTAKAQVVYYPGSEAGVHTPRFTYMGFRYVELAGTAWVPGLIVARPVHTEMARTGTFTCGDEGINRVFENQLWTQRSNYVEVPTDCPQRDERQGYTGDCHAFARTASYNYDTEVFLRKFLRDVRTSQRDNSEGYVAASVPATGPAGVGFMQMQEWASGDTIVAEMLYDQFGDVSVLAEQYESMRAMVECKLARAGEAGLWFGVNLGDWLSPGSTIAWAAQHSAPVSCAFMVNDLRIMVRAAKLLGRDDDAAHYTAALERARGAYQTAFMGDDGRLKDYYQGAAVLALALVLEPGTDCWDAVFGQLVEDVRANGMRTGFYATEHLLPVLVEGGEEKLAFDVLFSRDCPGWLYEVDRGATTIWERWDAIRADGTVNEEQTSEQSSENMVSFNHYAFGSVGGFLYRDVLGIRPLEPGFARVLIAPHADRRLGHAEGSYLSRAGAIRVSWSIEGAELVGTIEVPVEAVVRLPGVPEQVVQPGTHAFRVPFAG